VLRNLHYLGVWVLSKKNEASFLQWFPVCIHTRRCRLVLEANATSPVMGIVNFRSCTVNFYNRNSTQIRKLNMHPVTLLSEADTDRIKTAVYN